MAEITRPDEPLQPREEKVDSNDQEELYKKILDIWGIDSQLGMLQEECAELIAAVNKLLRNKQGAKDMVCEELADVQNMINQLKHAYPDFEKIRLQKLERVKVLLEGN